MGTVIGFSRDQPIFRVVSIDHFYCMQPNSDIIFLFHEKPTGTKTFLNSQWKN